MSCTMPYSLHQRSRAASWLLMLTLFRPVVFGMTLEPLPGPATSQFSAGGIDLSVTHGTTALLYPNGSTLYLKRVAGSPAYVKTMTKLAMSRTLKHDSQSYTLPFSVRHAKIDYALRSIEQLLPRRRLPFMTARNDFNTDQNPILDMLLALKPSLTLIGEQHLSLGHSIPHYPSPRYVAILRTAIDRAAVQGCANTLHPAFLSDIMAESARDPAFERDEEVFVLVINYNAPVMLLNLGLFSNTGMETVRSDAIPDFALTDDSSNSTDEWARVTAKLEHLTRPLEPHERSDWYPEDPRAVDRILLSGEGFRAQLGRSAARGVMASIENMSAPQIRQRYNALVAEDSEWPLYTSAVGSARFAQICADEWWPLERDTKDREL